MDPYDNPKKRKSWGPSGHALTSIAKPNIHGKKFMLCIWWDQLGVVYYELLRTRPLLFSTEHNWWDWAEQGKTRPLLYYSKHDNIILLHDKARSHVAAPVKTLETLKWEVLPHPPYSSDIAPSDYHLFRSMTHGLCHLSNTSHHMKISKIVSMIG